VWSSSNPALANDDTFQQYYGEMAGAAKSDVTTLPGVVNKTGFLLLLAIVAGAIGYSVTTMIPAALWISAITSLVVCIGIFFMMRGDPKRAPVIAPIYALVEGFFLGAFTCLADTIIASQGLTVAGGVGVQAFIITASCVVSMLLLYKTGLVRPTRTFQAVLYTATGAIMLAYLVSFIVSFFGMSLPLVSFGSAVAAKGAMGFLGLGINVFILIVASLWLIIDFKTIEDSVASGAPKYMEWYCGFVLMVTLAWIYFEAVKLVIRLAVLFGNRD
jgi:uncharacterized YccA/Bax inhibitor family protein